AAAEVQAGGRSRERADEELALAADVEEPHAKRSGGGQARERERCCRDERLAERAGRQERRVDDLPVARARVVAGCRQDDPSSEEGEEQRAGRNGERQPPRLRQPPLNLDA